MERIIRNPVKGKQFLHFMSFVDYLRCNMFNFLRNLLFFCLFPNNDYSDNNSNY